MTIKVPSVNVLMQDGTEHYNVRLSIADQLQWSKTCRARGWDKADELAASVFMAWHALHRSGRTDVGYEDFETTVEWIEEQDSEADLDAAERPTQPDHSID